jgi:hypothetical protein
MDASGKQLVFIISQPRSGSTLLQHLLGSHSQIHTLPEPWLMLHPLYALRQDGIRTEYDSSLARKALQDFLAGLTDGENAYKTAIKQFALHLYGNALSNAGHGKRMFLDKTPRYYFIISELYELFPDAHFIFLVRNPVAVLTSRLDLAGRIRYLIPLSCDFLLAPRLIAQGIKQLGNRACTIHYEDLVTNPGQAISNICSHINLPYEPEMLDYGEKLRFRDKTMVDSKSIYLHSHAVADYRDSWVERLHTPARKILAREYLGAIGNDVLETLGYPYDKTSSYLNNHASCRWSALLGPLRLLNTCEMTYFERLWLYAEKRLARR